MGVSVQTAVTPEMAILEEEHTHLRQQHTIAGQHQWGGGGVEG